jgi:hypothetical protein
MHKLIFALSAGSAIALAAPAVAQTGYNQNGYNSTVNANVSANLQGRIAELQTRLQAGVQSGAITRSEAIPLRQQVRTLTQLERQYSRNGLTQQERMDLQQRLRNVRQQFRLADGGGNGRWADNDGYNNNGNNGWSNNGYSGQGGTYEEVTDCNSRGGGLIGGVLNNVLGGQNSNCVSVGQRAPGNLSAVPYELRDQFRDANGIFYRTDGQRIYQIDARTNTVLRVYSATPR